MIDPPKILPPSKPSLRPTLRSRLPTAATQKALTAGEQPAVTAPPSQAAQQKAKGPQLARTAMTAMTAMKAMNALTAANQQQNPTVVPTATAAVVQLPEQLAAVSIAEPSTDKPVIVNSSAV
jgi:hypothetical protein